MNDDVLTNVALGVLDQARIFGILLIIILVVLVALCVAVAVLLSRTKPKWTLTCGRSRGGLCAGGSVLDGVQYDHHPPVSPDITTWSETLREFPPAD